MFVNYDNSSSESENEEQDKQKKLPQEVPKQIEETQKKKVKLLSFNQVMKKSDQKSTIGSSSSYTKDLLNEASKMDIQMNNKIKESNKDINQKRKLPSNFEDDEEVDCQIEQKYHKLNEKEEEIQQKKMEQQQLKAKAQKDIQIETKQKKILFIPPQARSKRGNVSTEF